MGNEEQQEQEEYGEYQEDWEELRVVYFAGGENEPQSDLDWEDVGNYGEDSEVGKFLQNNEETQGYGGLQYRADMGVYEVFAEEQIIRDRKGKSPRTFKQFEKRITATYKSRDGFLEMKSNVEKKGEREQFFEEKQARLAKTEGVRLKGDSEHRRSGRSAAGNKAACFECGKYRSL